MRRNKILFFSFNYKMSQFKFVTLGDYEKKRQLLKKYPIRANKKCTILEEEFKQEFHLTIVCKKPRLYFFDNYELLKSVKFNNGDFLLGFYVKREYFLNKYYECCKAWFDKVILRNIDGKVNKNPEWKVGN